MKKSTSPSFQIKTTPISTIVAMPVIAGMAAGTLVLNLLWRDLSVVWLPLPDRSLWEHAGFWTSGLLSLVTHGAIGASRWQAYTGWIDGLDPAALRYALYARFTIAGIASISSAAAAFTTFLRWRTESPPSRGRPLVKGTQALRRLAAETKTECKDSQPGIRVHPEIQISTDRETKHFLVMGASGSGKTQIIWQMLKEAIRRGDRVLVFDSKGEFTEELNGFRFIAPWDKRSRAWHIADDCLTMPDAREFAMRLIPDNDKDPLWPNASRQVLVALIVHLQTTQPGEWTFADLHKLLLEPISAIRQIASVHNPDAVHSLEEGSRTTQSIMINLMAFMAPVSDLAKAWGKPSQKRFSMRQWILDDNPQCKTVVMQGSQRYQQLARSCCNSLLSVLASVIASPELTQDPNRRIWLFLDEFTQLGRVRDIGPLIEMGRSKGLRIVIGVQDVAQLYAAYGKHETDAWTSSMATSLYTRLEGGSTTEWVSHRIGDKENIEANHSVTHTAGGTSETEQTHTRKTRTVMPAELKTFLGKRPDGVDVLVDGFDLAAYIIRYPFHNPTKRRKAVIEADWVKPVSIKLDQPTAQAAGCVGPESITPPDPSVESGGQIDPAPDNAVCRTDLSPTCQSEATARAVSSDAPKRWKKRPNAGNAS